MGDDNVLGAALGQLGQAVKQTVKQVVKIPEEMGHDLGGQIGGIKEETASPASDAASSPPKQEKKPDWQSDDKRIKYLRNLYGKSDMSKDGEEKKPTEFEKQIADKSPEEQRKLLELRRQLHKQSYYDPTFNPPKKQEERPAEKVENEKKKEMMELEKKQEKKPKPLAVVREQNKAEMFRGVAG